MAGDLELLGLRVEVMKLERTLAMRITTNRTTPTGLLNQDPLELSPSLADRLYTALATPEAAVRPRDEGGQTMLRTIQVSRFRPFPASRLGFPEPGRSFRFQLVLPHPMADSCQAALHSLRDLPQRQPG